MTATKTARHFCSCGRGFHGKPAMANHGRACPVECLRSAAYIRAIEGRWLATTDPRATITVGESAILGGWGVWNYAGLISGPHAQRSDAAQAAVSYLAAADA